MQWTLPNGTIVRSNFRFLLHRSFLPMVHITCAPTSTPTSIQEYENILLDWCGIIMPLEQGSTYRVHDLVVREATYFKATDIVQHEYVILDVGSNTHPAIRFKAKLERTLDRSSIPISKLKPQDRTKFEANLSEQQRAKVAQVQDTLVPSQIRRLFRRKCPPQTPAAQSFELLSSPSASLTTGRALDTVTKVEGSRNARVVQRVLFQEQSLLFLDAIAAASSLSKHSPFYSPFKNQCYFFADSLMRCLRHIASSIAMPVSHGADPGLDRVEEVPIRSTWGFKAGAILNIRLHEFQDSAFEAQVLPSWDADKAALDERVAARVNAVSLANRQQDISSDV